MVRSKFPGKPSKFNNRKLVNVSNCATAVQENEAAIAAEFIYFGLSVFKEKFGPDNDEVCDNFTLSCLSCIFLNLICYLRLTYLGVWLVVFRDA